MTGTNKWQNRIVGLGEADPADLLANPNNWRVHPKNQQDALKGSLDAVGWVDAAIVNQRTQFVVDGHLRVAMAISEEESSIPVLYVDLDEREEAIVLATFDPITGLAVTDPQMLAGLIEGIEFESPALERVVADILSDTVAADLVDDHEPQEGTSQENALLWGYTTFGKTKAACSAGEVDALQKLYDDYRTEHGGVDVGFVRWLADGRG